MNNNIFEVVRILILAAFSFGIAFFSTPILTHFLYKYRLRKRVKKESAPIFSEIHKEKEGTPTMGGILIWGTILIVAFLFWLISQWQQGTILEKFNFLSRSQTWLPLAALVASALIGLADDLIGIFKAKIKEIGLRMRHRILLYSAIAAFGAWWFYFKLDWDLFHIPFLGDFNVGLWYILIFMFIIIATGFSLNEADGLDGLAGGILLIAFMAYTAISLYQGKTDLAAFCGVTSGAILAFLWFNIHPARFFMGDTGAMALGVTLGIIAMLTNTALVLPFIGFILVLESLSVILQVTSKKIFHKKIFLSTPFHQHFQAKGWSETKVVERFWIIAGVMAALGLVVALLG